MLQLGRLSTALQVSSVRKIRCLQQGYWKTSVIWVGMDLGLKLQYFEGNLWEIVLPTLHWPQQGTGLSLPLLKANVSSSQSSTDSSIMIKFKEKYNLWNTLAGLSHSYSVRPQFTHSSFDILQLWDLKNCLSPCLGRYGGGKGCGRVMLLIHPFPSWKSLF